MLMPARRGIRREETSCPSGRRTPCASWPACRCGCRTRPPVAAPDAEHAEGEDDQDADRLKALQHAEVEDDDGPDEGLEDQQELPLLEQVGLAGLVDEIGRSPPSMNARAAPAPGDMSIRPNSRPSRHTSRPDMSSVRPFRPRNRTEPRSGRISAASPPGVLGDGGRPARWRAGRQRVAPPTAPPEPRRPATWPAKPRQRNRPSLVPRGTGRMTVITPRTTRLPHGLDGCERPDAVGHGHAARQDDPHPVDRRSGKNAASLLKTRTSPRYRLLVGTYTTINGVGPEPRSNSNSFVRNPNRNAPRRVLHNHDPLEPALVVGGEGLEELLDREYIVRNTGTRSRYCPPPRGPGACRARCSPAPPREARRRRS